MDDPDGKPLIWVHGEIRTPPFTADARIEADAIVILEVFAKRTPKMPRTVIETCKRRLREYLRSVYGD